MKNTVRINDLARELGAKPPHPKALAVAHRATSTIPNELMFFPRWSGQRIGSVFIFCRKVRPGSELHRPNTEASQIAEVHLANRILQDEGRVRDGKHIVGADSTLHHPAFLPPGRIFVESLQDTLGGAYTRVAHLRA
jgi:hypothetical protein